MNKLLSLGWGSFPGSRIPLPIPFKDEKKDKQAKHWKTFWSGHLHYCLFSLFCSSQNFRRIFGQPAWLCEGGRRRALYGYSTSSTETQSQHTPLPDGATIYSAIGRSNAKETIELGQCNWGGINEADHLLNYQFLPINLGSTELLPMHTRQMTWRNIWKKHSISWGTRFNASTLHFPLFTIWARGLF